jgi:hypothetical protein
MSLLFIFFQLLILFILSVLLTSSSEVKAIKIVISFLTGIFFSFQIFAIYLGGRLIDYRFFMHFTLNNFQSVLSFYYIKLIIWLILSISTIYSIYKISNRISALSKITRGIKILGIAACSMLMVVPDGVLNNLSRVFSIISSPEKDFKGSLEALGINYNLYKKPDEIQALKGKNIIILSLESLEKGYLDEKFASLTPNLRHISDSMLFFDMIEEYASSYTAGSIYTFINGVPAYFKGAGNEIFQNSVSLKISGLGQILNKAGYNITYLMGNPEFAGVREMLNACDINVKSEKSYSREFLTSEWGLFDKDLFVLAKEEILAFKKAGAPFALFLSTNSTHHPDGIYDKRMEGLVNPARSKLEFMVSSTDYLVGDFINFLKTEDLLSNTALYIFPDHLLMGQTARVLKDFPHPRNLYLITNVNKNKLSFHPDKPVYQIDLPKLILEGAEIKHNAKFLTDFIKVNDKQKFIKSNINAIVALNESSLTISNFSGGIIVKSKDSTGFEIESGDNSYFINNNGTNAKKAHIVEFDNRMRFISNYDSELSALPGLLSNNDIIYLVAYRENGKIFAKLQKKGNVIAGNEYNNQIQFSESELTYFAESDSITIKSLPYGQVEVVIPNSARVLNLISNTSQGINLLTKSDGTYFIESFNTQDDSAATGLLLKRVVNLIDAKDFFALIKQDSCEKYLKPYINEIDNLGFTKLSSLNNNDSYIGYSFSGFISEYKSVDPLTVVLPNTSVKTLRTSKQIEKDAKNIYKFIAHAGGEIDEHTYTNSLDALNHSYNNKFRLFELDIIKTSDNVYVAAHDWDFWAKLTGYKGQIPPSSNEFMKYKILGSYSPLDMKTINEWFLKHPDAVLVTDKVNEPKSFSRLFVDRTRLMMELFSLDSLKEGLKVGIKSAMPSENVIYLLEGDRVKKLIDLGVLNIAVSRKMIDSEKSFLIDLKKNSIKVFVYSVNDQIGIDESYVVRNDMDYIYGLYADKWDFR